MSKMIASVVKIIGGSILLSLALAFGIYVVQVVTLNNRVNAIQTSMASIVSDQNYLPSSAIAYYESQFSDLLIDMGGESSSAFVKGWSINCSSMSNVTPSSEVNLPAMGGLTVGSDLAVVQGFGSVQVIDIVVEINPPFVGGLTGTSKLHFTSSVPCQQYIKVN